MMNLNEEKEIKRGDIFYISIPSDINDPHKQTGCRPCIIISNDKNNKHCSRVQYIPLTSRDKKYIPTHAKLKSTYCLPKESIALCECIDGINKSFIKEKIGTVSEADMFNIKKATDIQLGDAEDKNVKFVVRNTQELLFA